ncbi:hypothetical protein BHE74_00024101 [Ensete ventricosum]|nr:hypothetical protein BHE74_00024101 [Ensete ventricosum]
MNQPTIVCSHVDIQSKEILEEAISEYQGTVITISHDRYFIRQVVNRVVEVKDELCEIMQATTMQFFVLNQTRSGVLILLYVCYTLILGLFQIFLYVLFM